MGSRTVAIDDPRLTIRIPGQPERSALRVVVEGTCVCPPDARVLTDAFRASTIVLTSRNPERVDGHDRTQAARRFSVAADPSISSRIDLGQAMVFLAARGVNNVLVEGGSSIAGAFLRADLVDEVAVFRAPLFVGSDGLSAIGPLGLSAVRNAVRLQLFESIEHGSDREERYLTRAGRAALDTAGEYLYESAMLTRPEVVAHTS